MARLILAYRYGDHAAGETVDVDDDEAVGLVRDGLARRADDTEPAETPADDDEVT